MAMTIYNYRIYLSTVKYILLKQGDTTIGAIEGIYKFAVKAEHLKSYLHGQRFEINNTFC